MPVGLPGSAPSATEVQYGNLVGKGAAFAGVDQGIDFTGAFDVFALADAVVTRVVRSGSGWPGEGAVVNYKILSGPAAGKYVYVAEDFAPAAGLAPGKVVRRGQVIGRATGSGKAPGIEVGWARPSGIPLADRPPPRPADQHTPQGEDFRGFVSNSGGGSVAGAINSAARHVPGVAQVEGAAGAVSDVGSFIAKIADPHNILRGLQVIAGGVLVLVGIVLLTRQVALAADVPLPDKVPLPGTGIDLYQSKGYAKGAS